MPLATRASDARQSRIMPVTDSILWTPAIGGAHRPVPLMFFAQHTLRKIHDWLASVPNGLGMGLLAGRSYTCNRTGAQFVLIDGALPLPALAAEDDPMEALADGVRKAAAGIEIVGWYRAHSFSDAALTPADVEAQTELFGDRPSVVAIVAAGGKAGGVFRHSASPAWPVEALPFYEWLGEPAHRPDGPKPTILNWRNYRASEPLSRLPGPRSTPTPSAPERTNQPLLLLDEDFDDDAMPGTSKAPWFRSWVRPAIYIASALVGAVLLTAAFGRLSSGSGSANGSTAGASSPSAGSSQTAAVAVLSRRSDTLALALTAFDDRVRMFEAHQMTCAGLSRGLQQVEDGWLAYNIARKETLAPFDSTREARDRSLYGDVRAVERRFERSGCSRP